MLQSPTPAAPPDTLIGFFDQLRAQAFAALPKFLTALVVFLVFLIIAWIGKRLIAVTAPRVRADTGVMLLLSRVFYYGVLTFGTIIALSTTGLDVSALVAGLGLTGFALGFALKDVLSNLLSGIMLLVYRPFHIGDEIVMGAFEGTIQTIRMRDTILRGPDGRTIIIPNTKLITEVVINNSTRELVRETVRVRLPADAEIGAACDVFARAMENENQIAARVEPEISVKREGDGTILGGLFWFDPRRINRASARERVVNRIKLAFNEAGVRAEVSGANSTAVKGSEPQKPDDEENELGKRSEI